MLYFWVHILIIYHYILTFVNYEIRILLYIFEDTGRHVFVI